MVEAAHTPNLKVDLNNLAMSEGAAPLLAAVKTFITNEIEPKMEEFQETAAEHGDRWSLSPKQKTILDDLQDKAKSSGLWNFFLTRFRNGKGFEES